MKGLMRAIAVAAVAAWCCAAPLAGQASADASHSPSTPIDHLIVIVGENHTFDNLFGAYQPIAGQKTLNLLSEGIIKADGSPGPNWIRAQQWQAKEGDKYSIAPKLTEPFSTLPMDLSRLPTTQHINSPTPVIPLIVSFRCGSSSTKAVTIYLPGLE